MSFIEYFPDTLVLETDRAKLRLISEADLSSFSQIAADPDIWTYFTRDLSRPDELAQWVSDALQEKERGLRFPFTIIDKRNGSICGSTSFGNISFYDKRIEVGWSWLGRASMGTGLNLHAKYLLLRYAFDRLGFARVEIKTDNLNERAKSALRKIGAQPEGVLRSHMQMPRNRRRDSIYFSILREEWSELSQTTFAGIS